MRGLLSLRLWVFGIWLFCCGAASAAGIGSIHVGDLPPEARATLRLIEQDGPFPYKRDGVVFGNYEKRLPLQKRGYYREYTVPTPGLKTRGARRIITGNGDHGAERYYTADHYNSFSHIIE